jgi:VanZ family protein
MLQTCLRVAAWLAMAFIVFVTLSPLGLRPVTSEPPQLERFAAFLVLGGLFAAGYPKRWPVVMITLVAFAVMLEAGQELAPTRHAHLRDAMAKALGAFVGAGAVGIWLTRFRESNPG